MVERVKTALAKASAKVASKATKTVKAASGKASAEVSSAMLKLGAQVWRLWDSKAEPWAKLGIRQATALRYCTKHSRPSDHVRGCNGTRAAMLAVANYGYKDHAEAERLTEAVRAYLGLGKVGGVSFTWLEDASNIATITPIGQIRPDAKDGKHRLMVRTGTGKAKVTAKAIKAESNPHRLEQLSRKAATSDRTNGPVKHTVDKALRSDAARQARAEQRKANRAKQAAQGKAKAAQDAATADIEALQASQDASA